MAIAFVNSCSGGGNANTVTSSSMDTTGANLIVVSVATYGALGSNLTDSQSNTWTALTTAASLTNRAVERLFYCIAPTTSSSHTFTFTQQGTYPSISAVAFSGVAAYESENTSTPAGNATTVQTNSVTPSKDGSLVFAGACTDGGIYTAVDSGFTLETSVSHNSGVHMGSASAYLIQTTAAAVNPQFTNSINDYLSASIAVFKPAKTGLGDEKLWLCPSLDDSADDISGNGNHGTYNGGMGTVSDVSNGGTRAYSFDGVDDYINCGSSISTPAPLSVSCWFNSDQLSSFKGLVTRTQPPGYPNFIFYVHNNGELATYIAGHRLTSSVISASTWYHACFTLDSNGNLNLYLNGTVVRADTSVSMNYYSAFDLLVGVYQGGSGIANFFDGLIDDIRIFDRALTTSEITSLASKRGYEVPAASSGSIPHPLSAPIFHPLG
jgi:hypothetical protein